MVDKSGGCAAHRRLPGSRIWFLARHAQRRDRTAVGHRLPGSYLLRNGASQQSACRANSANGKRSAHETAPSIAFDSPPKRLEKSATNGTHFRYIVDLETEP